MKNTYLIPAIFFAILSLNACKDEKGAHNFDESHPAVVQDGKLEPLVAENYVPPKEYPKDSAKLEGYIDTDRYSLDGVNKYQRADALIGIWPGVEGTSLQIGRDSKEYKIIITNLDGPTEFSAWAEEEGIAFKRDGKKEIIRMGDGIDTEMKYLADKVDCLYITKGAEGFCRD
jgi:hypothetical protein